MTCDSKEIKIDLFLYFFPQKCVLLDFVFIYTFTISETGHYWCNFSFPTLLSIQLNFVVRIYLQNDLKHSCYSLISSNWNCWNDKALTLLLYPSADVRWWRLWYQKANQASAERRSTFSHLCNKVPRRWSSEWHIARHQQFCIWKIHFLPILRTRLSAGHKVADATRFAVGGYQTLAVTTRLVVWKNDSEISGHPPSGSLSLSL